MLPDDCPMIISHAINWGNAARLAQRALNDLAEIIGHIAEEDDDAASRFWPCFARPCGLAESLSPHRKQCSKRSRVRQVLHSPILVYYQIREDKRLVNVFVGTNETGELITSGENR
jgi:plasmid stabilization system protein ParE